MLWEVLIPGNDKNSLATSVVVEADNWFSALRSGLDKSGLDGKLVSNLACDIKPDQSVLVTDFVTRKVFSLRPVVEGRPSIAAPNTQPAAATEPPQAPVDAPPALPGLADDLVPHKVFFWRDECPADGSGILFRERLLAVAPGTVKEDAGALAIAYFERLKAMPGEGGAKLFVSVQVFDHEFKDRSLRPAVAALTWKEWNPKKPKLQFPLFGEGGVTLSTVSPPIELTRRVPAPAEPKPLELTPSMRTSSPPAAEPKPIPLATPARGPARKARISVPPPPPPGMSSEPSYDEKMDEAFHRMQGIFEVRDHDAAARFALALVRNLVSCEAGSCMLLAPGRYELYVAAAEGPAADVIVGRKLSLSKGIVGFTARTSSVVSVSDPQKDPRFSGELDALTGFNTRNVACAPIQHEGHTLGVMELVNSPEKGGFERMDVNVLAYIAGALAEYMGTSLPSREADFSDKDWAGIVPVKDRSARAKAAARAPAAQQTAKKPAAYPSQAKPLDLTRPAAKPSVTPAPAARQSVTPAPAAQPPAGKPPAQAHSAAAGKSGKKKKKR
jgi:hypothetical protein